MPAKYDCAVSRSKKQKDTAANSLIAEVPIDTHQDTVPKGYLEILGSGVPIEPSS